MTAVWLTPAQALLAAVHAGRDEKSALWRILSTARRRDGDPVMRCLHTVPSEGEYWDQVRAEIGELDELDQIAQLYVDL